MPNATMPKIKANIIIGSALCNLTHTHLHSKLSCIMFWFFSFSLPKINTSKNNDWNEPQNKKNVKRKSL